MEDAVGEGHLEEVAAALDALPGSHGRCIRCVTYCGGRVSVFIIIGDGVCSGGGGGRRTTGSKTCSS